MPPPPFRFDADPQVDTSNLPQDEGQDDEANYELDDIPSEQEASQSEEAEGAQAPVQESEAVDEMVESLHGRRAEDPQLSLVEQRLELAQYYKVLLETDLFAGQDGDVDGSAAAQQVAHEVRTFVRNRLEILMGVKAGAPKPVQPQVVVKPQFSVDEERILKKIAEKIINAEKAGPAPAPGQPTLNRAQAPSAQQPSAVPAQPARPRPAPAAPKPAVKPQQPARAAPKPRQQAPAQPFKRPAPFHNKNKNPDAGKEPPIDISRVPTQYQDDPTLRFKGGRAFIQQRNAEEEPLSVYNPITKKSEPMLKDVTLPARPSGVQPLPMPSDPRSYEQAFNNVAQSQGDAMLGTAEKRTARMRIGNLFQGTLVTNIIPGGSEPSEDDISVNERM